MPSKLKPQLIAKKPFITFGAPVIGPAEIAEVVATLKSGWIGTGPRVGRFERQFARSVGSPYAVAVNSCTAALHLSMLAAGVKPGDEVITSPLTFCATANVIIHCGATPVFADVSRQTMNLEPKNIARAITKRTRAIIPVHFAGRPCEMRAILALARRHRLTVIEDAAHALGASYHGRRIGTLSDLTCFSFYATKNITTAEGGMVTTRHRRLADAIKIYALHGLDRDAWQRYSDRGYRHYTVRVPGFKYNLTDLGAAIGIHQLRRLAASQRRRAEIWRRYQQAFRDLPATLPAPPEPGTRHAYHLYTLLLALERLPFSRDEFMHELHRHGIGSGVHFIPVHLHPYYRTQFGYRRGDFPNSEWIGERTVSLPFSQHLSDEQVERIIQVVRNALRPRRPVH